MKFHDGNQNINVIWRVGCGQLGDKAAKMAGLKQYQGLQTSITSSSLHETSLGPQSAPSSCLSQSYGGTRYVVLHLGEWQNLSDFKVHSWHKARLN